MNKLIDIHSHILHNIDDGPDALQIAVEICRIAAENGTSDIIATPHLFHPKFSVELETAKKKLAELKNEIEKENLKLNIYLGFECRINENLINRLIEIPEFTLCGKGKYFLLEFDRDFVPPPDFYSFLFEAKTKGMQPILVHPERYKNKKGLIPLLESFVGKGLQLQVNAAVITGKLGDEKKCLTEQLLKMNLIHYVASDIHNTIKEGYELPNAFERVKQLQGKETADKLFIVNPGKIIGDSGK